MTGRPRIDARLRAWIRFMYYSRHARQMELANFLGLSQASISRIVSE